MVFRDAGASNEGASRSGVCPEPFSFMTKPFLIPNSRSLSTAISVPDSIPPKGNATDMSAIAKTIHFRDAITGMALFYSP